MSYKESEGLEGKDVFFMRNLRTGGGGLRLFYREVESRECRATIVMRKLREERRPTYVLWGS